MNDAKMDMARTYPRVRLRPILLHISWVCSGWGGLVNAAIFFHSNSAKIILKLYRITLANFHYTLCPEKVKPLNILQQQTCTE